MKVGSAYGPNMGMPDKKMLGQVRDMVNRKDLKSGLVVPFYVTVETRTKELMTSLINGALRRRTLAFPQDDGEIEDQFTTHTYTLSNGNIIYSKGNDHIIDAVRCAILAREQGRLDEVREETVSLAPLLTNPVLL